MTYTGKPSRGCATCRRVHAKCDERRPKCSRCIRLTRVCNGYRDEVDLMFRMESGNPGSKSIWNARTRKLANSFPPGARDLQDTRRGEKLRYLLPGITQSLLPSQDDRAVCYFYEATIATLAESDHSRYLHQQLPGLLSRSHQDSALYLATQAISHAVWAKSRGNDVHAMQISKKRYVQAISALRIGIRHPIKAKSDETLYAVLLLCGYETITYDLEVPSAWGSHVDGATALLEIRGKEQLSTPLQRTMFLFIRRYAVHSHVQLSQPVEPIFNELADVAYSFENPEDRLLSRTTKVPQLQSLANDMLSRPSCGVNECEIFKLILAAESLDCEFVDWTRNLPAEWSYSVATHLNSMSSPVHSIPCYVPGEIHGYPNFNIARVWNLYRVSRLIIQSILLRAGAWLQFRPKACGQHPNNTHVKSLNCLLVNDICASVPFLLGYDLSQLKRSTTQVDRQVDELTWPQISMSNLGISKHTGRFSLIWPLYVACSVSTIPEPQQWWMRAQLKWIAKQGETQAKLVAGAQSQTLLGRPEDFRNQLRWPISALYPLQTGRSIEDPRQSSIARDCAARGFNNDKLLKYPNLPPVFHRVISFTISFYGAAMTAIIGGFRGPSRSGRSSEDLVSVEDYEIFPKPSMKQRLSPLDMNMPRLYGSRWILCFPLSADADKANVFEILKEGLAHTIASIPWIAGDIGLEEGSNPENNRIQVVEGSCGVKFRCRDLSSTLPSYTELRKTNFPFSNFTTPLISPLQLCQDSQPVLAAQANFIKGGLLLTVGVHHATCDATGLDFILETWAFNIGAVTRFTSFSGYDPISNDRTPLFQGMPAKIADCPEYIIQSTDIKKGFQMGSPASEMPSMTSKIFYFSPKHLADLKKTAKAYLINDAICAFFWHHMTIARNPNTDKSDSAHTSNMCFSIDIRGRTSPPLSPTYLGNASFGAITQRLLISTLTQPESGLALAAAAIRSAVNNSKKPNHVLMTIGLLSSRPNTQDFKFACHGFLGPDVMATSWADIGVLKREWGALGKPEAFRVPYEATDGTIAVLPKLDGGGLEVMASLESMSMERMVRNEEFTRFAQDWA